MGTLATLTLALATWTSSGAMQATPPPARADQVAERLQELRDRLALTPEQEERIRPILAEEAKKLQALRDQYEGQSQTRRSRTKMVRELKDIQSAADDQLGRILTKTQMQETKKIREERRERLKHRAGR